MSIPEGKPVIAINTRHWIPGKMEGVGRFEMNMAQQLSRLHPEVSFLWIFDRKPPQDIVFPENVRVFRLWPQARHPWLYKIWYEWALPRFLKKHKASLFISPDNINSLRASCPTITVIHDINFEHDSFGLPDIYSKYYKAKTPAFIQKAEVVLTVSEYSKLDISEHYGTPLEKIQVIKNGISPLFKPLSESEVADVRIRISSGRPYFFVLGSIHPRKNLKRTLEAYTLFRKSSSVNYPLVISGRALWSNSAVSELLHENEFKDDIIFTGYLDDEEVARVMGAALALLFLSLFEGFGVPIVEAFASGVPVIASETTSIPEVSAGAALLTDPRNANAMADAMIMLVSNQSLQESLRTKGLVRATDFSWEQSAAQLWLTIEKILKQ